MDLQAALDALPRPAVACLSGVGGAGKSTLAASLRRVHVVPGDGFLIRALTDTVTDDWAGVDRVRLGSLLDAYRRGGPADWDAYDWDSGGWTPRTLPAGGVLLVEGVGLIHPSLRWDLAVWLDVDPEVALARALARDGDLPGWPTWHATDLAYVARFAPAAHADLVL